MFLDYSNIAAAFLISLNLECDAVGITTKLVWGILKKVHGPSLTFNTPDLEVKISNNEINSSLFICIVSRLFAAAVFVYRYTSSSKLSQSRRDIETEILHLSLNF